MTDTHTYTGYYQLTTIHRIRVLEQFNVQYCVSMVTVYSSNTCPIWYLIQYSDTAVIHRTEI